MQTTFHEFDIRLSAIFMAIVSSYLVPAWVYILLCIFIVLLDSFFGVLSIKVRGDTFSMRRFILRIKEIDSEYKYITEEEKRHGHF